MVKLLLGLVKGLVIGAGIGYGAFALGFDGGFNWLTYGLIGAFVGLLVGKPLWSLITDKEATVWVAVLKSIVGFGVACGIYALVAKVWGGFDLEVSFLAEGKRNFYNWQPVFGGALGAVYGGFVELDDSVDDKAKAPKRARKA
ncbi:MAG: hypothetical protein H6708_10855 [Kofleriaceae bacterium]|nr:hypothetical protein [Myxococcales bacterium]MCB9560895.1 hypothetical protein [Kofleriaceae bacterium]